ncbi:hypothetical protein [Nonomuraea helvata]|uniref:Uncharacterized protein n=1 Tax=Nonomuraea helvata TaxID=37484 RepID=A0ABV5S1X3_9ACTN
MAAWTDSSTRPAAV